MGCRGSGTNVSHTEAQDCKMMENHQRQLPEYLGLMPALQLTCRCACVLAMLSVDTPWYRTTPVEVYLCCACKLLV